MLEIIYQDEIFSELDQNSSEEIEKMRREFYVFDLQDIESERLLLVSEKKVLFYTFTSTKINKTLKLLFDVIEIKNILDDRTSMFYIMISKEEFLSKLNLISSNIEIIGEIVTKELEKNPDSLTLSKRSRKYTNYSHR